jgi:hypothetical protein
LYNDCHAKRENDEGDEESNSKPCAGRGVGNHTWAVVLSKHHENSGSDEQPQQAKLGKETPLGARRGYTYPVMRPIHVLVRDNDILLRGGLRQYLGRRS